MADGAIDVKKLELEQAELTLEAKKDGIKLDADRQSEQDKMKMEILNRNKGRDRNN